MRFRERYSKPRRGEWYARVHDLDIPGAVQLAKWSGVSASTATWCALPVSGMGEGGGGGGGGGGSRDDGESEDRA